MAIKVRDKRILETAEMLRGEGKSSRQVIKELRRVYRVDWDTADEYVRLADTKTVQNGLTIYESADLATVPSLQYQSWLRRAVTWFRDRLAAFLRRKVARHG